MQIDEKKEKEILKKWNHKIKLHGNYHEIEIVIAFRIMIQEGYNTFKDMLETLKIVCTYNIYEIDIGSVNVQNVFTIDNKHYYISKP